MQITVCVKTLDELHRLIIEIALDLKVRLKSGITLSTLFGGSLDEIFLKLAAELLLEEIARKVRDVGELSGARKANFRPFAVTFKIIVAALPRRVVGYRRAADDVKSESLGI